MLFPNLTQLDFTGPLQVLGRLPGAKVYLAASSMDLVTTDGALTIPPNCTFKDCPPIDILCIPGGFGIDDAMNDPELMSFVRREGVRAKYVTSVCTGAFILGAAGLLEGKRATTHWAYHDELAQVGAIPERARVVRDGNVFTGGGVTAGIDFAMTLASEIAGEDFAKSIQLGLEYDPAPPFRAGSPEIAPPNIQQLIRDRFAPRIDEFRSALAKSRR